MASPSPSTQQLLLRCAADLMDRTLPAPALRSELATAGADQLTFLVRNRDRIAAIPPSLWRASQVPSSDFPGEHYAGLRAAYRFLKGDASDPEKTISTLLGWLGPVWARFPALKAECEAASTFLVSRAVVRAG